ncbi:MAG: cyclic nucleotide-binding domain-containing protein [Ignavibacteriaceae bacterium]
MPEENKKVVHSSFWTNIFSKETEWRDLKNSLASIPLFKDLSKRDLSLLMNIIHNRSYLPGEYIFYQGDPGLGLYIVRDGEVKIERTDDTGNAITLAVMGKGDFFGELALIDGEKRSASAIALTEVRVAVIFKPDLDEFIETYPRKGIAIMKGFSQITASRLRRLNEDFISLQNKLKITSETNYET